MTGLIQNEQNTKMYCIIKAFYKTHGVTSTTSGTIFSADVWISGGQVIFQYRHGCIPLEAFASKKGRMPYIFTQTYNEIYRDEPNKIRILEFSSVI